MPKYRPGYQLFFPPPDREYLVYQLKKDKMKKRQAKNFSNIYVIPYFLGTMASLLFARWLWGKGLKSFTYGKHIFGGIVGHFLILFTPIWYKICRGRSMFEETIERLTLQ